MAPTPEQKAQMKGKTCLVLSHSKWNPGKCSICMPKIRFEVTFSLFVYLLFCAQASLTIAVFALCACL